MSTPALSACRSDQSEREREREIKPERREGVRVLSLSLSLYISLSLSDRKEDVCGRALCRKREREKESGR